MAFYVLMCHYVILLLMTDASVSESVRDYCMFETFHPQCYGHEVIAINYAVYGRRRVGRCIQQADAEDLVDHLGCYADVRMLLDSRCSGKTECDVRIPDPELQDATPCSKMLMMYLEASYSCVTGKYTLVRESELRCYSDALYTLR